MDGCGVRRLVAVGCVVEQVDVAVDCVVELVYIAVGCVVE